MSQADENSTEALKIAIETQTDFKNHTMTCAARYDLLSNQMSKLEKDTKAGIRSIWRLIVSVGGSCFALLMSVLAYLLIQTVNRNEEDKRMLTDRLNVLTHQEIKP